MSVHAVLDSTRLLRSAAYINGQWVEHSQCFEVFNPASQQVICQVADLGVEHIKQAIDAAYKAQVHWAQKTAITRADILLHWHALIVQHQDDLARIITLEMGKPFAEAKAEVAYGASFIRWFAEEARRVYGDVVPASAPDKRITVIKQPVGLVASITPWNFPHAMIARKVAPALAAGCSFVAKPAEKTPLSALALAVLAEEAGIPPGVLNIVTGTDYRVIGEEFCSNKKVRKLSFTGSTQVGSLLMQQSAGSIKKLSMELGGNAPFIVFEDADIDQAVEGALIAKYRNSGQTCVCANRLYVHASVYEAFATKLVAATQKLKQGEGFDSDVSVGPLVSEAALDKVKSHVQDATDKGATVLLGGKVSAQLGGLFYEPTVLTEVGSGMKILEEETFGPVAPLIKFESEEEVISLANDTDYGLVAYFFTNDMSRMWRVAEALETGMVGVNTGLVSTVEAPFGGIKSSGIGREGSRYGMDEYLEKKYICTAI